MAERFAEHGANVILLGRKQEKLDAAAEAIRSDGGSVATHAADVRDYAAVEAALKSTRDLFGEIDILVCGAAGNFPAPVTGISSNGFRAVIDIDLLGHLSHLSRRLRSSAQAGRVDPGYFGIVRVSTGSVSSARRRGKSRYR